MIIPPIDVITLYIHTSDQSRECGKEFIPDLYGKRGPRRACSSQRLIYNLRLVDILALKGTRISQQLTHQE
jgi:hypothetical protein